MPKITAFTHSIQSLAEIRDQVNSIGVDLDVQIRLMKDNGVEAVNIPKGHPEMLRALMRLTIFTGTLRAQVLAERTKKGEFHSRPGEQPPRGDGKKTAGDKTEGKPPRGKKPTDGKAGDGKPDGKPDGGE